MSTHSATGCTTESTDSLLISLSLLWILVYDLCNMYISGTFVLVIFDLLLKEFYGIMGQL